MKELKRFPRDKSTIRYIGGYDDPNCDLVVGCVYEILGQYKNSMGIEMAYVRMDADTGSTWYIKGNGDGEDNDFDKFEIVEEFFNREDLIAINADKDNTIDNLNSRLNTIVLKLKEMIEAGINEEDAAELYKLTEISTDN